MAAANARAARPASVAAKEAIVLDSDTDDSDIEVAETGETTPETHGDAEYKEPVAVDEEADRNELHDVAKEDPAAPVSSPAPLDSRASVLQIDRVP